MPATSWPAWVVCGRSYEMWQAGRELPAHLQLSADAAVQVMRIKYFAAEQAATAALQQAATAAAEEEEEEEEEEEPPLQLPCRGPMAAWASPEVLARVAGLSRAVAPDSVPRM